MGAGAKQLDPLPVPPDEFRAAMMALRVCWDAQAKAATLEEFESLERAGNRAFAHVGVLIVDRGGRYGLKRPMPNRGGMRFNARPRSRRPRVRQRARAPGRLSDDDPEPEPDLIAALPIGGAA
jgi:hypothetical protein